MFSVLLMLFILFYFILFLIAHITMTFVFVLRVTCMCPFEFFFYFPFLFFKFFFFLLMTYILYSDYLTCQEQFLFYHYRLYHHCHHHNHFIFFNTTSHWGRIQQMNSSGMVYPYPLVTLGSRRVSIIFYFYSITIIINFFCKLYFGDHC